MSINFKEAGIATLAGSSVFYVVKFDSLHKIPGISTLADALMGYPTVESLVLGLLLGVSATFVFLLMWQYFSYLHGWNRRIAKSSRDILEAAQKRTPIYKPLVLSLGAGVSSFFGALAIVGLIQLKLGIIFPNLYVKNSGELSDSFVRHVLFSPFIETIVCVIILELGLRWISNKLLIVVSSALLWGALHASLEPINFFATTWIFFVISDLYITLRESTSIYKSGILILVTHLLNNLFAFGVVLIRM